MRTREIVTQDHSRGTIKLAREETTRNKQGQNTNNKSQNTDDECVLCVYFLGRMADAQAVRRRRFHPKWEKGGALVGLRGGEPTGGDDVPGRQSFDDRARETGACFRQFRYGS